jgi:hypothetical protein
MQMSEHEAELRRRISAATDLRADAMVRRWFIEELAMGKLDEYEMSPFETWFLVHECGMT